MSFCTLDLKKIDAVIFDLDGVVVDSAGLHAEAWEKMFNAFLLQRGGEDGRRHYRLFDYQNDYLPLVDGKPRYVGVASFLKSRGIDLPYGDPGDDPDRQTVCGLGNRKNQIFNELLQSKGAEAYESSIELIRRLREQKVKTALVTSSKNGRTVLKATGLQHLFDVIVDGNDARDHQLEGKPAPDAFLLAARLLGVAPERAAVFEDAQSGVEAGRRGGFGCVIGVDRGDQEEGLRRHGADCVVRHLDRIRLTGGNGGRGESHALPFVLDHFKEITERICEKEAVVFLDYDGTLTPIVRRPEDAGLSEDMRTAVEELAQQCRVAIVSGRDLEDVRQRVGIGGIYYAGSHGFDIRGPRDREITYRPGERFLPIIEEAARRLRGALEGFDGVHVEHKKFSVAVHYRNAPEAQARKIEETVQMIRDQIGGLRLSSGKKVFDMQPDLDWHKGKAVRWLMEEALQLDLRQILPIYIGDDVTDEDAFEELRDIGVGIVVDPENRTSRAHFRVRDTGEVQTFLEQISRWLRERTAWRLKYDGYDPKDEKLRETLCTLGNGYFCTRGASAQDGAGAVHYPGTYLAGGYNRLKTEIAGHIIENEDLVNIPNWLPLTFRFDDGPWFSIDATELLSFRQDLDIRRGILHRHWRCRDGQRITRVHEQRIVSMDQPHLAALTMTVTPENWSGPIEFRSALDGRVTNAGVARYKGLNNVHLKSLGAHLVDPETVLLKTITTQSDLQIAMAARTRLYAGKEPLSAERRTLTMESYAGQLISLDASEGTPIRVEKIVSVFSSKDTAITEPALEACHAVDRAAGFDALLESHYRAWDHLWRRFRVELWHDRASDNQDPISMIVHLYMFHLLQTASVNTMQMGLDIGIPSRGWHGEAYRGHVFWDEVFVFPTLNWRQPQITRALLMYRYRRLGKAREIARREGYPGAMYPWQSGSNGREESQRIHLNPRSGRWIPDNTHLQRHVNIAIAYNLVNYYQVTNDLEFMSFYGAEMMMEIARFLAGLCSYNAGLDRYEILNVMGPDEYHDAYPGVERPGLNNNAYTNIMTVWVLNHARRMLDMLPTDTRSEVCDKLQLHRDEFEHWEDICRKMRVVFHGDGIISQFEGYDDLQEFDWQGYRAKYGDIQRLDRILEAEEDTPNRYKASKQADVLMLFYLLSAEELGEIFEDLGYTLEYETIPKNIEYYIKRTSHGSTLSRVVHAWVLARSDRIRSWELFDQALQSDVADIQGGTTTEGIHLGAMAGTVDQLQRGYTGIVTREDVLWFNPCLPTRLHRLRIHLRYRSHFLEMDLSTERLKISSLHTAHEPIRIGFEGKVYTLSSDSSLVFALDRKKRRSGGECDD